MRVGLYVALGAAGAALWAGAAVAGPCAADLYKADQEIGKRLDAIAAEGKAGAESTFATTHHQPTPSSIASAEEKVGDISEDNVKAVRAFMVEAHKADDAGDKAACENALAQARKILGM